MKSTEWKRSVSQEEQHVPTKAHGGQITQYVL